nr:hypothetical protein GZ9D8_33 [uncultured archaeon GZfos9D8]
MVAVTVVMAAIVGSFLYGFIGGGGAPPAVSATATYYERADSGRVIATYTGGPDHDFVYQITVAAVNESAVVLNTTDDIDTSKTVTDVGSSVTFDKVTGGAKGSLSRATNHVVVTAEFLDNTTSVILDTWV